MYNMLLKFFYMMIFLYIHHLQFFVLLGFFNFHHIFLYRMQVELLDQNANLIGDYN